LIQHFLRFIVIFCSIAQLTAQADLSGQVTDGNSPIANAQIFFSEADFTDVTNSEGRFVFPSFPEISTEIIVYKEGYQVFRQVIDVANHLELIIVLQPLTEELTAVVIREQRELINSLRRLPDVQGTAIYAGKKTEVVDLELVSANIAANNAREIYAKVAGLNIYDNGDAGLQLNIGGRGLDPNRTAHFNVRQNGYDISADPLGYPESYYTPPPEALDEIQVVRGAASLQYGPQFGGLINFKFKRPSSKPIEVVSRQSAGSFNMLTSFNSLSGTIGKIGYYGYFHYKEGSNFRPNSGFTSRNGFGHLEYNFNDKTTLSVEATVLDYLTQQPGGLTDRQFYEVPTFSNRERNWFQVEWLLLNAKLDHRVNENVQLSLNTYHLNASRSALGFRVNRVSQPDDPNEPRELLVDDFRNFGAEGRLIVKYDLFGDRSALLVGSKFYTSANEQRQGPGSTERGPDFSFRESEFPAYPRQSNYDLPNQNLAFFAENLFKIDQRLSITPGLRYEYIKTAATGSYRNILTDLAGNIILNEEIEENRELERDFVLAGVGASFKANRSLEVYANFSQNYRSVTFNDLRVLAPNQAVAQDIEDEKGFTADLGLRGSYQNVLRYDASLFYLNYDGRLGEVLVQKERGDDLDDRYPVGSLVRLRDNIGRAEIYGVETLVNWSLKNTFYPDAEQWQAAMFSNLTLTRGVYTQSRRNNVEGNMVEFIPEVNWRTGIDFGYRDFTGSLQYTYFSEQFTDATNAPQIRNDNQRGIEGVIPAYGIIDLSFAYTYKNFTLETGLNNLLDNSYFTRRATGYPGPGIIPANPRTWYVTLEVKL
jgi:Fe(3+) dicitrate transport protein